MQYSEFLEALSEEQFNAIKDSGERTDYFKVIEGEFEDLMADCHQKLLACGTDEEIVRLGRAMQGASVLMNRIRGRISVNPQDEEDK